MKSTTRIRIGLAVQIIAILFSLMSWTDPLEGGVAMVLAIGVQGFAFAIGRVGIPKLTWMSSAAGVALMIVFWVAYINEVPNDPTQVEAFQPSAAIMALLWAYRVASIAFISGAVFYAVIQFTALRGIKQAGDK